MGRSIKPKDGKEITQQGNQNTEIHAHTAVGDGRSRRQQHIPVGGGLEAALLTGLNAACAVAQYIGEMIRGHSAVVGWRAHGDPKIACGWQVGAPCAPPPVASPSLPDLRLAETKLAIFPPTLRTRQ